MDHLSLSFRDLFSLLQSLIRYLRFDQNRNLRKEVVLLREFK